MIGGEQVILKTCNDSSFFLLEIFELLNEDPEIIINEKVQNLLPFSRICHSNRTDVIFRAQQVKL